MTRKKGRNRPSVRGWQVLAFCGLAAVAAAYVAWAGPPASDPAAVMSQVEKLMDQEKYDEAIKLLGELVKTNPNHPDVYWKTAQCYYEKGERIPIAQKAQKLDCYVKCEEWARKGYAKNPNLADNSFWLAVGLSQQAQTNGIAKTIMSNRTLPKEIENYFIKCTQAKEFHFRSEDSNTISSAHMALGVFYRKIPSFPGVDLIIGTKGDLDKSVDHNRTAVRMFPNNLEYTKELGVSLLCRGVKNKNQKDIDEGKKYLTQVTKMPAKNQLDKTDQADAKRLMADPNLACGYSRVQQEEVTSLK